MQPNRGSSSRLAKANGQRSNMEDTERGRNHRRDAESAEKTSAGAAPSGSAASCRRFCNLQPTAKYQGEACLAQEKARASSRTPHGFARTVQYRTEQTPARGPVAETSRR